MANDTCAAATAIVITLGVPFSVSQSTLANANDPTIVCEALSNDAGGHAAWFRFTPAVAGLLSVDTHGSDYDTELVVYHGTCDALRILDASEDDGVSLPPNNDGYQSSLTEVPVKANVPVYIAVADYNEVGGALVLTVTLSPAADTTAPQIIVGVEDELTGQAALYAYRISDGVRVARGLIHEYGSDPYAYGSGQQSLKRASADGARLYVKISGHLDSMVQVFDRTLQPTPARWPITETDAYAIGGLAFDASGHVYLAGYVNGTDFFVKQFDADLHLLATSPFTTTDDLGGFGVSPDGATFYYYVAGENKVRSRTFATGADLGILIATDFGVPFVKTNGHIVLAGGSDINEYNSDGTLFRTTTTAGDLSNVGGLDPDQLHLWTMDASGASVSRIRISDGAVISTPITLSTSDPDLDAEWDIMIMAPTGRRIWPVWLNACAKYGETFLVFTGTYLGNGSIERYTFDGELVQTLTYDPARWALGMIGMTAMLDSNACLQKIQDDDLPEVGPTRGMVWLAGHYTPEVGVTQPGILPIRLDTGEVLAPVITIPAPSEVDQTAGFTVLGSGAYASGNGDPTDQGLPPKPTVVCNEVTNLRSPASNPGCNSGGRGWVPVYTGASGTIPTSTDPSNEETLTGKTDILVDVKVAHTRYLADGTEQADPMYWAHVDLDDTIRKEGRLGGAGTVEISSSDAQGNMKSTSAAITIFDDPGHPIALRRSDPEYRNFNRDEMTIKARSDTGRRAGLIARFICRVLLYGDSCGSARIARLNGVDHLFIEGGSFSPDKTAPQYRYPLSFYTMAPPDVAGKFIPYLYGEKSDEGAINPTTGLVNARGLCPVTFLGMDTTLGEEWGRVNFLQYANKAVIGLYGSDCGGLGCFGMGAVSDGKATSTVTLSGVGDFSVIPGGGWAQLVLLHPQNGRSEHRITRVNLAANSVKVEGKIDATALTGAIPWFIERIDHLARRVKIDIASRQGVDVMIPGYTGYVRPTPYEDISCSEGEFRMFDGWVRGVLLAEHLSGGPTLSANLAGLEDRGDGSGELITEYFTAYAHWWDNFVHTQSAKPTVDIGGGVLGWPQVEADCPQWSDAITKTMHSSFAVAQAQTVTALGGVGLTVSAYFNEGISLRDAAQLWNDNGGCWTTVEEHGRVKVFLLDQYADTTTWPRIDDVNRVFGTLDTPRAVDEQMNVVRGGCDFDPDGDAFREDNLDARSAAAIRRNKGYVKSSKHIDGKLLGHPAHLQWVLNRKLAIHQDGPIYVEVNDCDFGLVDYPIGSGVVFTSQDGPGADGYVEQPLLILDRKPNLDGKTCSMLFLDVGTDPLIVRESQQFILTNDVDGPRLSNDLDEAPRLVA